MLTVVTVGFDCLGSTDPSTGEPGAQLLQCSADTVFHVSPDATSSGAVTISRASDGLCLDITAHSTAQCAAVEGYACNGGANQGWRVGSIGSQGAITSIQDGHCLSVAQLD